MSQIEIFRKLFRAHDLQVSLRLKEEILMPKISERNIPSSHFAVIREYQPARIEGELLAQVFEIAERRCSLAGVAGERDRQVSGGRQRAGVARPVGADASNLDGQMRPNAPETVA